MERDIDDLLDEVESKYVNRSRKSESNKKLEIAASTRSESNSKPAPKNRQTRSTVDDAIDDILDLDIEDGIPTKKGMSSSPTVSTSPNVTSSVGRRDATKKCFPIFLGGSSDETGLGTTVKTRACDQLRCTDCDFRICYFDDFSWKKETNYLFLRNNVPDFQKLKSNLRRQKGCRAYCCQCNWRDISTLQEISDSKLKWVCGKHAL